jgi:hypothetical protein
MVNDTIAKLTTVSLFWAKKLQKPDFIFLAQSRAICFSLHRF